MLRIAEKINNRIKEGDFRDASRKFSCYPNVFRYLSEETRQNFRFISEVFRHIPYSDRSSAMDVISRDTIFMEERATMINNLIKSGKPEEAAAKFKRCSYVFRNLSEETRENYPFMTRIFSEYVIEEDHHLVGKSLWNNPVFILDRIENRDPEVFLLLRWCTVKFDNLELLHAFVSYENVEMGNWLKYFDRSVFNDPELLGLIEKLKGFVSHHDNVMRVPSNVRHVKFPFPKYAKLFQKRNGCEFSGSYILHLIGTETDIKPRVTFTPSDIDIFINEQNFTEKIIPLLKELKIVYKTRHINYTDNDSDDNAIVDLLYDVSESESVVMPKFQFIIRRDHSNGVGESMDYPCIASVGLLTDLDLEITIVDEEAIRKSTISQQPNTRTKPDRFEKWIGRGFTPIGDFDFGCNFTVTPSLWKLMLNPTVISMTFEDPESLEYALTNIPRERLFRSRITLTKDVATNEWIERVSKFAKWVHVSEVHDREFIVRSPTYFIGCDDIKVKYEGTDDECSYVKFCRCYDVEFVGNADITMAESVGKVTFNKCSRRGVDGLLCIYSQVSLHTHPGYDCFPQIKDVHCNVVFGRRRPSTVVVDHL